jgi:hypothetical protein
MTKSKDRKHTMASEKDVITKKCQKLLKGKCEAFAVCGDYFDLITKLFEDDPAYELDIDSDSKLFGKPLLVDNRVEDGDIKVTKFDFDDKDCVCSL